MNCGQREPNMVIRTGSITPHDRKFSPVLMFSLKNRVKQKIKCARNQGSTKDFNLYTFLWQPNVKNKFSGGKLYWFVGSALVKTNEGHTAVWLCWERERGIERVRGEKEAKCENVARWKKWGALRGRVGGFYQNNCPFVRRPAETQAGRCTRTQRLVRMHTGSSNLDWCVSMLKSPPELQHQNRDVKVGASLRAEHPSLSDQRLVDPHY